MIKSPCDDCELDCDMRNTSNNCGASSIEYEYQFPAIQDYSFDELQALKILEELGEFVQDIKLCKPYNAMVEAFDIIHATETYLRNQDQQLVNMAYEYAIRKNEKRGYYGKQ